MKAILCWVLCFQFLLLLSSCKKDKVPTPPIITNTGDNCPEMYMLQSQEYQFPILKNDIFGPCMMGFNFIDTNKYYLTNPAVNPNNPFEFAFLRFENEEEIQTPGKLYIFNFCKNELRLICDEVEHSQIIWTKNNDIIFLHESLNIYKIKSDGTNQQLLFPYNKKYIKITGNPNGNIFMTVKPNVLHGKYIFNLSGELLKDFTEPMSSSIFINDSTLFFNWNNKFYNYNIYTDTKVYLFDYQGVSGLYPSPTQSIVYAQTNSGNYRVENGIFQLIDSNYANFYTQNFHPLSNNYYLIQRTSKDTIMVGVCSTYIYHRLSVFNSQTNSEREIKFPF